MPWSRIGVSRPADFITSEISSLDDPAKKWRIERVLPPLQFLRDRKASMLFEFLCVVRKARLALAA